MGSNVIFFTCLCSARFVLHQEGIFNIQLIHYAVGLGKESKDGGNGLIIDTTFGTEDMTT